VPTLLVIHGWRFFFYSNERDEPVHIHCQKAEQECKYWLDSAAFDIIEAYSYGLNSKDKNLVRRIIFENFDYIISEWNKYFPGRRHEENS